MSDNSGKTSGSFARSLFRKVTRAEDAPRDSTRFGAPASILSNGPVSGQRGRSCDNTAETGVPELNRNGFKVYNLPDQNEIFVSNPSESAFMDEEDSFLIKVSTEDFSPVETITELKVVRPKLPEISYSEPADVFANAMKKTAYEEIDYNEVIVKKSSGIRVKGLFSEAKEAFRPQFSMAAGIACTSTGAVAAPNVAEIKFEEKAEETVEAVKADGLLEEQPINGLYVENHMPANAAVIGEKAETAFMGKVLESVATDSACAEPAKEAKIEIIEEPVAKVPEVFAVNDIVADIMRITVPGLYEDSLTISDLPKDAEMKMADDGLESRDFVFKAPVTFTGAKVRTIGSSLNLTF